MRGIVIVANIMDKKISFVLDNALSADKLNDIIKKSCIYLKVVVDGDRGVGKTTLLKRLTEEIFDPSTKMTCGIQFFKKDCYMSDKKITVIFWDISGSPPFDAIRELFYKGTDCLVVVGDISRMGIFNMGDLFKRAKEQGIKPSQIILAINKWDLKDSISVDSSFLTEYYEQEYGITKIVETSAKSGFNVEKIFDFAIQIALQHKNIDLSDQYKSSNVPLESKSKYELRKTTEVVKRCPFCGKVIHLSDLVNTESGSDLGANYSKIIKHWEDPTVSLLCVKCKNENERPEIVLNYLSQPPCIMDRDLKSLLQFFVYRPIDGCVIYTKDFEFNSIPDDLFINTVSAFNDLSKRIGIGEISIIKAQNGFIVRSTFNSGMHGIIFRVKKLTSSLKNKVRKFKKICEKELSDLKELNLMVYNNEEKMSTIFSRVFGPESLIFFNNAKSTEIPAKEKLEIDTN